MIGLASRRVSSLPSSHGAGLLAPRLEVPAISFCDVGVRIIGIDEMREGEVHAEAHG